MDDIGHCPLRCEKINKVLARIGDRWSLLVIIALSGKKHMRFNELKRHLSITQRMLSLTLRQLERDGLVTRTAHATVPPTVEYALTDLGQSFEQTVKLIGDWAIYHLDRIDDARAQFDAREAVAS